MLEVKVDVITCMKTSMHSSITVILCMDVTTLGGFIDFYIVRGSLVAL